jgi:hypothetical protein
MPTAKGSVQERLESALEELEKWQARKSGEKAKRETRVSTSDPQARVMKHPDKGFVLSYNAQISTDAAHGLIVGVAVTQEANDSAQLPVLVPNLDYKIVIGRKLLQEGHQHGEKAILLGECPFVEGQKLEDYRTELWTENIHRFHKLLEFGIAVHQCFVVRNDLGKCCRPHFRNYVAVSVMLF